jgi:hypothetical protein
MTKRRARYRLPPPPQGPLLHGASPIRLRANQLPPHAIPLRARAIRRRAKPEPNLWLTGQQRLSALLLKL